VELLRGGDVSQPAAASAEREHAAQEAVMMDDALRADLLLRLKKINGQGSGIARMVEQDRYCVDVLQQVNAAQSALEAASRKVARNYPERCVADAVKNGDSLVYDEGMRVVFRNRQR
jgi:DNA-binding FrmR family transcriptional regulator